MKELKTILVLDKTRLVLVSCSILDEDEIPSKQLDFSGISSEDLVNTTPDVVDVSVVEVSLPPGSTEIVEEEERTPTPPPLSPLKETTATPVAKTVTPPPPLSYESSGMTHQFDSSPPPPQRLAGPQASPSPPPVAPLEPEVTTKPLPVGVALAEPPTMTSSYDVTEKPATGSPVKPRDFSVQINRDFQSPKPFSKSPESVK